MSYLFLALFVAGVLLGVRLLFFGAERRKLLSSRLPLRRSEPAAVAFLVTVGVAGYLLDRMSHLSVLSVLSIAAAIAATVSAVATRLAIATARISPAHDPNDRRFALQGHIATVSTSIPARGEGAIVMTGAGNAAHVAARSIDAEPIEEGAEVCIERVENDVAFVERWSLVERRL